MIYRFVFNQRDHRGLFRRRCGRVLGIRMIFFIFFFTFSIVKSPGRLPGRLPLGPGSVGIDIPNPLILPHFFVGSTEIIVLLMRLDNSWSHNFSGEDFIPFSKMDGISVRPTDGRNSSPLLTCNSRSALSFIT